MSWRVVLIEKGEYLRLKLDNLLVTKSYEEFTIPLSDISIVIVENIEAIITARLLDAFTNYNIALIICDYKHTPSGIYYPLNCHSRSSKILKTQLNWTDYEKCFAWQYIVKQKIINQMLVLKYFKKDENSILKFESYIENVELGDSTNREGHAAKVYFNSLFGINFIRREDDIYNICLNYGYSIIRAYITRLIVGYGLTGLIGIFHKSEYNNFNLADDLLEPFRSFIDLYVYKTINKNELFTIDIRKKLVGILDHKIIYNNEESFLSVFIEKYIISFINFMETGDISILILPNIKGYQFYNCEI